MKDLCSCGNEKDRRAKNCRPCSGAIKRTNFTCSVDGCVKDAWSQSLCPMHLQRLKKHGDVERERDKPTWNHRGPYSGCWEWTGHVTNKGKKGREYGFVMAGGKRQIVSRLSWEAVNDEPIPPGIQVCHRCDNPRCWRPDHLFLGTSKENMEDRARKGRNNSNFAIGFRLPHTRLSEDEVTEIRSLWASGSFTQVEISQKFSITPNYVSEIINNKKRVTLDPDREYKSLRRRQIWDSSNGSCRICGDPADPDNWHVDHIIPLSKGGSDTYDNVQVSHPLCNWKKNNKLTV